MKRFFPLLICTLSLQIVKASDSFNFHPTPAEINISVTTPDTTIVSVKQPVPLSYQGMIVKRRLDSIKKDIQLDYNDFVQNYIDLYAHNRDEMGQVLGLTKYYFPIYEKAFKDAGIPDEIKYLSIVESKLDPNAVSRVGATGPWQFMATTGKMYGLNTNEYVDERRDPIQASYAAAAYLKDAYEEFGDWLLAIASYNCGKSNVEHALEKANGANDFWSIRQYLPSETRNYVPAFIAVAYLMNYYDKHNIVPQACSFALKTDTVLVNKYISLSAVAQVLNIEPRQLTILNPAYRRQIINGTDAAPRRLVIPQIDKEQYGALYEALNNPAAIPARPVAKPVYAAAEVKKEEETPAFHKVRHGETLGDIADSYGISLKELKTWNHLHSSKAPVGQKLRLTPETEETAESAPVRHRDSYITYKVRTGDTLSGIASKFEGASIEKIRSVNGLKRDRLQPGMTIKITRS